MQNHLLPGAKWRNTHQATVNSVLGSDPQSEKYRKVRSVGSQFYNKDSWYARAFGASMCEWARLNRDSTPPTESEVRNWISVSSYRASAEGHYERGITIAETPDDLSRDMAMALVGGAYHEAWHTEYSRRERIQIGEVWPASVLGVSATGSTIEGLALFPVAPYTSIRVMFVGTQWVLC